MSFSKYFMPSSSIKAVGECMKILFDKLSSMNKGFYDIQGKIKGGNN